MMQRHRKYCILDEILRICFTFDLGGVSSLEVENVVTFFGIFVFLGEVGEEDGDDDDEKISSSESSESEESKYSI